MPKPILTALAVLLMLLPTASLAQRVLSTAMPAEALAETSALVVDIRAPHEWVETGVLPNALLMTFTNPAEFMRELQAHLAPGQPVMLVCRTGNRTARAAAAIAPHMPVPVVDVQGGMMRMIADGYSPDTPTRAQGCTVC